MVKIVIFVTSGNIGLDTISLFQYHARDGARGVF